MLLLQWGALLKRRSRVRCCCDCGRIWGRRGDAVGTMRRRERGKSGGSSGVGVFILVERMVATEAAVVEGVVFVRVGAGAVGVRRMMVGEIFVDVGATGKGALDAALLTANSGFASCGEGFETFFHALSRIISFLFRTF